jgi:dTDP-glucose 4,6-dehydratase
MGKLNLLPSTANILVTGGAGFIGSNFIRYIFGKTDFTGRIVNYYKLTYAGKKYCFERGDICDYENVKKVLNKCDITIIVHEKPHLNAQPVGRG